jgi:hypothetical protein
MDDGASVHNFLKFGVSRRVKVPQKPNFQIPDQPDTIASSIWRKRASPGYFKKCNRRHNLKGHVGNITHSDLAIRRFLRNFNRSRVSGMEAELHILVATRLPC